MSKMLKKPKKNIFEKKFFRKISQFFFQKKKQFFLKKKISIFFSEMKSAYQKTPETKNIFNRIRFR